MAANDLPNGGGRIVVDKRLTLGDVLQLITIIAGGLFALATLNAQVATLKDQLGSFKSDLILQITQLRTDLSGNTERLDQRIDNLRDSRSPDAR